MTLIRGHEIAVEFQGGFPGQQTWSISCLGCAYIQVITAELPFRQVLIALPDNRTHVRMRVGGEWDLLQLGDDGILEVVANG